MPLVRATQCPSRCPRESTTKRDLSLVCPPPHSCQHQKERSETTVIESEGEERENLLLAKRAHSLSQRRHLKLMCHHHISHQMDVVWATKVCYL